MQLAFCASYGQVYLIQKIKGKLALADECEELKKKLAKTELRLQAEFETNGQLRTNISDKVNE